jgi:tRNA (guanine37-N1)-methyltransferase
MSSQSPYIKVPSIKGEKVRKVLLENGLLATSHRIISEDSSLYLPLIETLTLRKAQSLLDIDQIELGTREFPPATEGPNTLADALSGHLTEKQLGLLPRAYDSVGDIAVLEIPEEMSALSERIGEAFLEVHSSFSTVLGKIGAISGTTRIRDYKLLAGQNKTDTIHIEYGCKIRVDLAKAYFSPRLLEEHNQVANQVVDGETILDMFTGVGPFALHIAKLRAARILAVDINPAAISLLKESLHLNKLVGEIVPIVSNARDFIREHLQDRVDRIIMNHPSGARDFIQDACQALKPRGILHYYEFMTSEEPEGVMKAQVPKMIESAGRSVDDIIRIRRVRDSAPYEYQMVCDIRVL